MFPVFRSLSLRYLRLRWERAVLVVFSIALGVATLVSTRIMNQCLEAAAHDTMTPIPTANLYVDNGEIGVVRTLADDIKAAKIPGIEAVVPMIFEQVRLTDVGSDGRIALLLAVDFVDFSGFKGDGKRAFKPYILDKFSALMGNGIFISEFLYRERQAKGIDDSEPVRVNYAQREMDFPLSGYLMISSEGAAASFERNLVAMNLDLALGFLKHQFPSAAAHLLGGVVPTIDALKSDRVSRIDIHTVASANIENTQRVVQAIVGDRAGVKTLEEKKKSTEDVISGIKISFQLCSVGALIVGLFLVYNALSVSVTERRHDIGILRSLGATRIQVARLFAGESVLLGFAGALLGIPLGSYLANTAIDLVKDDFNAMFLNPDLRPTKLSYWTMLAAVAAGMLTALMAALVPAIQAANDQPADAVRRSPSAYTGLFRRIHQAACVLLIGCGMTMVIYRDDLPARSGGYGGFMLVLVGMFLSLPILVGWLAWMMQPLFRALLGLEARLAADNLIRAPARTGVVIGALAAGVALMFQTAGVGRSNEEPIKRWIEQVIQADSFVFSGSLTSANSSLSPMQPHVGESLRKVEGVERVVGLRFLRPDFRDSVVCLVAIDAKDYAIATRTRLPEGLPELEKFKELPDGDFVVVSENFAAKFKIQVGDIVTLPRRQHGPVYLTVVGIGVDYTWSKGTVFIDRKKYVELFEDEYVDTYHVFYKPEADKKATRRAVEEAVSPSKLVVEDKAFVREFLAGIIDKLYRLAYLQQIIIGVVAALGVVTALLISVLQRRRELGLLRAVGATQLQVLKSVVAEAFLMGVIGTILGIALGLPMEWYLLNVVLFEESGFFFEMIVPWKEAIGISAIAIAIATLAGLIPALHAVRLRIVDAIAYE